jgi:hypothetical protein
MSMASTRNANQSNVFLPAELVALRRR